MLKKLAFLFLLFIIVMGCSNKNIDKASIEPQKTVETVKSNDLEGMALGLTDETSIDSKQTIHKIKSNNTYSPEIYIKNNFHKEYKYRLFFFKDYKQSEVIKNKHKVEYVDIKLKAKGEERFSIEIPSIEEGLHDFLVIAVRSPENILNKKQFVDSGQVYLSRRVALISGNNKRSSDVLYSPVIVKQISNLQDIYNEPFVSLVKQNTTVATLISKSELKNARINMGSTQKQKKYVLITIQGKHQIFINKQPYIETPQPGNFEVELSNLQFNSKHAQNLIVILVENPYTLEKGQLLTEDVKFTNLITIKP